MMLLSGMKPFPPTERTTSHSKLGKVCEQEFAVADLWLYHNGDKGSDEHDL